MRLHERAVTTLHEHGQLYGARSRFETVPKRGYAVGCSGIGRQAVVIADVERRSTPPSRPLLPQFRLAIP